MSVSLLATLESDLASVRSSSEPNALLGILATVDAGGTPRARTVIVHDIENGSALLLVSRFHQKWAHLQANPRAELLLWWITHKLQYRLIGTVSEAGKETTARLWAKLPDAAKQLDHAYGEDFLPGQRIELSQEQIKAEVKIRSEGADLSEPPAHVRAIYLELVEIERLEASPPDRVHNRQRAATTTSWLPEQLIP